MWKICEILLNIDQARIKTLPPIIIKQDAPHDEAMWQTITPSQKVLLIALSQDSNTPPFSKDFQLRHQIGPPSTIFGFTDEKGRFDQKRPGAIYQFADLFFPYWIEEIGKPH